MIRKIIKRNNAKLNFLSRQGNYLNHLPRGLLCNDVKKPHFNFECTLWYSATTLQLILRMKNF